MGKKEEKVAKDLQKKCRKEVKKICKGYSMKTISNSIYKKMNNFFFHCFVDVDYIKDEYLIYGMVNVKPYSLDEIFWDVFDAEENKKSADSLRVNGAYVAPSLPIELVRVELTLDGELEVQCRNFLMSFEKTIESYLEQVKDIESFINYHKAEIDERPNKLLIVLLNIIQGRYDEALTIVDNEMKLGKTGGFRAESKSIFEFAKEYCEERLLVL